ncbi:MAG: alpha-L-arabinofuranosidase C-terminal domain-containing protein [Bacteroidaceae bacterium]|nr:alpha-L-arabinofuranosidase C-terminal domain-containing protein [Bacteroidaceae bacterium]
MKIINTLQAIALAASLGIPTSALAQKVKAPAGGKQISNELIGIFFEDISYSADGGLYSELIQNGSFEYNPTERDGWGPGTEWRFLRPGHSLGQMMPQMTDPIHPNNPTYMRLTVERVGHYYDYDGWTGVGMRNDGFDGIAVKGGAKYDFSVFLRNGDDKKKDVRIVLVGEGNIVLGEATITAEGKAWKKYTAEITASADYDRANLQLLCLETGVLDVDMVSLMPQDTYKGHGIRRDMAEALEALNPKFMRFPGGCVIHGGGDGFWNTYRWKTTIGPKEQRRGLKNTWGYHQSMGLGYYEYFQLCEDMGMQPLPILPCGVSCQGTNGGWGMKTQAQDVVPMSEMDEWLQDALDLIEWANGDVNTTWGKKRAEQGHPAPFNLKYLGIGNEEKITKEFEERFKYMYKVIREKHPEIVIVGTAGPGSHKGNPDFDNGWRIAEEIDLAILDEHYYEQKEYFLNNQHNYDNYPRDRKTKVYLGEYASKDRKLQDALAEALYLLGIERNGDVVTMTSYAPLFAKKNHESWNPDLIYFDNTKVYPTCSYYVQQMFGTTDGHYYYGDVATIENGDKHQGASCVLNTEKGELYIKYVNAAGEAKNVNIDMSRFKSVQPQATITSISGQPWQQNYFDGEPIKPVTKDIKVSKKMTVTAEPYSCSVIRIKVK